MADINNVTIVGRLTKDADVTYATGGFAVAKFSIASSKSKKQGNQWVEDTFYFDVELLGKRAEALKPYLLKGKQVIIDGNLRQDRWEKDGQKFSRVKIFAEDIQLLGGKDKAQSQDNGYDDYTY